MEPPLSLPDDPDANLEKFRQEQKEKIIDELVTLLEKSGKVSNRRKLLTDLINRERRATTALGQNIAVPHVRTMQIRQLTMAIAISKEGLDYGSLDGEPTHIFFVIVSPSHTKNDMYLKIYKHIAEIISFQNAVDQLLEVESSGQMIRVLKQWE